MVKFLCDQMCANIGRWLRAAGYDTTIIMTSAKDELIFKQAIDEKRLLLTRDRFFQTLDPKGEIVLYLEGEILDEWAAQLKERGIHWLYAPFTRCLECNSSLKKIDKISSYKQDIPQDVKEIWECPHCNHLYWLGSHTKSMENQLREWEGEPTIMIGLGGDLMIGRLVNEAFDHLPYSYIWGDLLPVLKSLDCNIVNLETALTLSDSINPKVFNFKADPSRVSVLKEGKIDVVNLANNHILDFSRDGLLDTLDVLDQSQIFHVGAGKNEQEAKAPVIMEIKGIKIGFLGCTDNEPTWRATSKQAGTFFLEVGDIKAISEEIESLRPHVDLLILSIHWGPNMRLHPLPSFQAFARKLIDMGVDILHGHSAHVFQGVEVYKDKLILYDTGDLVDDYAVDHDLRNDRSFYFVVKVSKTKLISLKMIPTQIERFQVNISEDNSQLLLMERLCHEFKNHPTRKDQTLFVEISKGRDFNEQKMAKH